MTTRKQRRTRPSTRKSTPGGPSASHWLYGLHAVHAALENPRREIRRLIATEAVATTLPAATIRPEIVDRRAIDETLRGDAVHQGIAAQVLPLEQPDLETALTAADADAPLLVLDHVTDPHNVGAILRSAAAFGAQGVITTDRHAPPETGALAKAAAGALERVPLVRVANLARALSRIAQAGYWVLGLAADGARGLAEAAPVPRTALVLGAEDTGLRRLTRETCDEIVRLPIRDDVDSLNVSNAAAVGLYELTR